MKRKADCVERSTTPLELPTADAKQLARLLQVIEEEAARDMLGGAKSWVLEGFHRVGVGF